ncbi:S-layer homology domain-containing protein [Paenibacillus methanolicus]|uniref:S-layer family protein n=1 Tax=Paenibacillus methanolicus TaxID=582686 RepID=A0A5S5CEV6_9BACL|nr:S-layer homology domain-containing protein [Paenibacillus methanolicus]TYP77915.1 S-layer family protein [Paenibacillus methanolicus]
MKKTLMAASLALLAFASATSAFAFSDTNQDPNSAKITQLQQQGVVSGNKDGKFLPKESLTFAAGLTLIAKGLKLDYGDKVFVKAPQATDYFDTVDNKAWYANAFVLAGINDLGIPRDVNPSAAMTREQFAHYLFRAMIAKQDLAFIEIYKLIGDEDKITADYMGSIQNLLIAGIVKLDAKQNFNPTQPVTRSDAAAWTHDAIAYLKEHGENGPKEETPSSPLYDLTLSTKAVNERIHEVTLTAQVPHPGYGIRIASITFEGSRAIIHVEPVLPEKGQMYPQVITDVHVTTYIDAAYIPEIAGGSNSSSSSAAISSEAKAQ